MSHWIFDQRWCAPHGIGRFATELRRRLTGFQDLKLAGSPAGPLDSLRLAMHLRRTAATGFFTPGFNVPLSVRCPVITTIHDLIHIHFAAERSTIKQAYYRYVQRPIVRDSPVTLTVSQYSRREICDWYNVPESRVVCVGNGVSKEFTVEGAAFFSERPYFLYVGNCKPHKNLPTLIEAFSILRIGQDAQLVLVCDEDGRVREQVESLGLSSHVNCVSGLSDAQLACYYRGAVALVLPSHYEGFGLPLVEAMASGCPVIGSDCTSIPEVIGDAGLLFESHQPEELAMQMNRLLDDGDLHANMRQLGIRRAADFSWESVAAKVHAAVTPYFGDVSLELTPLRQPAF